MSGAAYIRVPVTALIIDFTTIINTTKRLHSSAAYAIKCFDDMSELIYLFVNHVLFDQSMSMDEVNRFNYYEGLQDFLSDK